MRERIRVFIVDDSAVARAALSRLIQDDERLVLAGTATNGQDAVDQIPHITCHIILMDILMPILGGLEATEKIMQTCPTPILLVSDLVGRDASLNFRALEAGALDVLRKPARSDLESEVYRNILGRRLVQLAQVPVVTRRGHRTRVQAAETPPVTAPPRPRPAPQPVAERPSPLVHRDRASASPLNNPIQRVVIGSSTGGPAALHLLLERLGRDGPPPWPILIAQHIGPAFVRGMANWLSAVTKIPTTVARDGEKPEPGTVYLAPADGHMILRGQRLALTLDPTDARYQPSIDALFASVADSGLAQTTVGVQLTGMGDDGAAGLLKIRELGGYTLAQDYASAVVDSMPRAAVELGAVCDVLELVQIAERLLQLTAPDQPGSDSA